VSGLLLFDAVVIAVCVLDILRFSLKGLSLIEAVQATADVVFQDHGVIVVAIAVFLFFIVGIPIVTALFCVFRPSDRWPSSLGSKGGSVLPLHVFLSFTIACFSATAVTMEVLSGWSKAVEEGQGRGLEYSFVSFWLLAVFVCKFVSVAYLSPIFKKIFWRAAVDHHGKGSIPTIAAETVKEVVTEHNVQE